MCIRDRATTLPDKILNGNLSYGVIEAFEAIFTEHFGSQYNWLVLIAVSYTHLSSGRTLNAF